MGETEETAGDSDEKLSESAKEKEKLLDSLIGIATGNPVSLEEAKKERLARQ